MKSTNRNKRQKSSFLVLETILGKTTKSISNEYLPNIKLTEESFTDYLPLNRKSKRITAKRVKTDESKRKISEHLKKQKEDKKSGSGFTLSHEKSVAKKEEKASLE